MSISDIFSFNRWCCYSWLFLGAPGYSTISQCEGVTRDWASVIRGSTPVCVGMAKWSDLSFSFQRMLIHVYSFLEICQNSCYSGPVCRSRVFEMLTQSLDHIHDIRTGWDSSIHQRAYHLQYGMLCISSHSWFILGHWSFPMQYPYPLELKQICTLSFQSIWAC